MKTVKTKTVRKPSPSTVRLVTEAVKLRDRARRLYKQADALEAQVFDAMGVGQTVTLADGRVVTLVDNFAKGNVAFRPAAVSRFELKVK